MTSSKDLPISKPSISDVEKTYSSVLVSPSVEGKTSTGEVFNAKKYLQKFDKPEYKIKAYELFQNPKYPLLAPLSSTLETNIIKLLSAINPLRDEWGLPMTVTSGYRSLEHNKAIGGAKNSNHCKCLAIDIADPNGKLATFCLESIELLRKYGLHIENPEKTKGWVHFQCVAPRSGSIVFNP